MDHQHRARPVPFRGARTTRSSAALVLFPPPSSTGFCGLFNACLTSTTFQSKLSTYQAGQWWAIYDNRILFFGNVFKINTFIVDCARNYYYRVNSFTKSCFDNDHIIQVVVCANKYPIDNNQDKLSMIIKHENDEFLPIRGRY